jgi:TRAP-type mannitol/chloroaromatic compound transport system permease small subunit
MALQGRVLGSLRRVIGILDLPGRWAGKLAAWLILPMVFVLVYEVISRYALNSPTVWAYDITYMFYGTLFLLGAAYALGRDSHVRADFLYNILSPRYQGVIDAALYVTLFFPAIGIFTWIVWGYATNSWEMGERIPTSPWMPVIYPYKAVMPVMGVLLLIQGVSELLKSLHAILANERFPRG